MTNEQTKILDRVENVFLPLVKEVFQNLEKKKKGLENWNAKLKKLNILRNSLNNDEKRPDESNSEASENTD